MTSEIQAHSGQALNEEGKAALANGEQKLAREAFGRGAHKGHAGAQYNYGVMCLSGEGGPQDLPATVKWFRKSAEQGHDEAQANLLGMHSMGLVKLTNPGEVSQAVLRSANRCEAFAQYNAGEMYATGEFVPKDLVEAYKWLTLATAQGVVIALARLAEVHLLLSPEQREVAHQRISDFRRRAG